MEDNTAYVVNRAFRRLVVPTTLSTVALVVSIMINAMMVANYEGAYGLAVCTLLIPLLIIWGCLYEGLGVGAVALLTKNQGRGTTENGRVIVAKANTITISLAIIIALSGLVTSLFLTAKTFGINQDQFEDAIWYARILFIATIPVVVGNYLTFLARANSAQNISAITNVIFVVLNIGLNLLFMGVLDMGIRGAAVSILTASSASAITILIYMRRKSSLLKLQFKLPDIAVIRMLSRYALNTISDNLADLLFGMFVNIAVLSAFGLEIASIIYIINYILMFAMSWGLGVAYSTSPMMGVYFGERDNSAIKMVARKGLIMAVLVGCTLALLVTIFTKTIVVDVFNFEYEQLIAQCVEAIRIFSIAIPFYIVNIMLINYCQQLEKFKISITQTILANFLLPILMCAIAITTGNPQIMWYGYPLCYAISIFGWFLFMQRKKRRERLDSILCLTQSSPIFKASMHFLIRKDEHNAIEDYQDMAGLFLTRHKIEESVIRKARLAIDEIVAFAQNTHQREDGYIAIELGVCWQTGVQIVVKLENESIDLQNLETKEIYSWGEMLSVHVLQSLSSQFKHQRVLSFNTYDLLIDPQSEMEKQ